MPVDTPSSDHADMLSKWTRARDAYDGEDAVKAKGTAYLPTLASHASKPAAYNAYLSRAMFYNSMRRTVDGLAGAIFQKAPEVEAPDLLDEHLLDVTLGGEHLEQFAYTVAREILTTGRYGVLVDMSEADAQRPYWVGYRAEDIISHRSERIGGVLTLTRVVLREYAEEQVEDDPFVVDRIEQYRVLELIENKYTQQVWRMSASGDWVPWSEPGGESLIVPLRRGEALDYIPFIVVGSTGSTPVRVENPPLDDLVAVLFSHYRNMADLEHGLHFTGVPQLVIMGAPGAEDGPLEFGSGVALMLDQGSDAKILQASGETLGALERVDERKRRLMATLGARLLEEQPRGAETATAVQMRHSGEHATLRSVAQSLEKALTVVLRWHGWWVGLESNPIEVDAELQLNKDYLHITMSSDELKAWVMALQSDAVSYATFYAALERGEMTRPSVDAEGEQDEIERGQPEEIEPVLSARSR